MSAFINISVAVMALNAQGSPEWYVADLACTKQEIEVGYHIDRACNLAEEEGFTTPVAVSERKVKTVRSSASPAALII